MVILKVLCILLLLVLTVIAVSASQIAGRYDIQLEKLKEKSEKEGN